MSRLRGRSIFLLWYYILRQEASQSIDSIKEKSAITVHLFEAMAEERNIVLKLKTKE
jgi:hypothetical protein